MSIEEIRIQAFAMQTRIWRNIRATAAFGAVLLALATLAIFKIQGGWGRMLLASLTALIGIVVYRAIRIALAPDTLPRDAALNACLDFYRSELRAQYRAAWSLDRSLIEAALFVLIIWLSIKATFRYEAIRFVLPAYIAAVVLMRIRRARRLKRELRALDAFVEENK